MEYIKNKTSSKHILFSIECATSRGSLSFHHVDLEKNIFEILTEREWERARSHSEVITLFYQEMLKEAGLSGQDITHLALDNGPGSFTGIRVALNFAKALSYAQNIPVFTENSLRITAESLVSRDCGFSLMNDVVVILKAFRNIYYCAHYKWEEGGLVEKRPPCALVLEEIYKNFEAQDFYLLGDAYEEGQSFWDQSFLSRVHKNIPEIQGPRASDLGLIFKKMAKNQSQKVWNQVEPLYLRGSEAEEKLKRGLLKPVKKLF